MDNAEMLALFDQEVRRRYEWARKRREVLPRVVRHLRTDTSMESDAGFISWSDLNINDADAIIQSQIEDFGALHQDFDWVYYSYDLPADLPRRLLAHGFTAEEPVTLMAADLDERIAESWVGDGPDIQRITTPEGVDEIVRLQSEVWRDDVSGFAGELKYDLEHNPADLSVFAVWQEGRMVSAAWTRYLRSTSFAALSGGATLKAYRQRGFYSALLAARAHEAGQRGFSFLQVYASPDSQPILAKHGFRSLAHVTLYRWKPEEARGAENSAIPRVREG